MNGNGILQVVGQLTVPAGVMNHRFAREALANAMLLAKKEDVRKQVVGTANTKQCELYGWAPNVDSHVDDTGHVYLACLNPGESWVHMFADETCEGLITAHLLPGTVLRMDDHFDHWTTDAGPRVAAFVGSFDKPDDQAAIGILQAAVDSLARGDYYGAPRVREGFRIALPDECWAARPGMEELELMLRKDAKKQRRYIEMCGKCQKPAMRIDPHWPYHMEMSRCRDHLAEAEVERQEQ